MWILDSSVAVKWFFTDEPLFKEANEVLDVLKVKPDSFLVPDLFYMEFCSALLKKTSRDAKFVEEALSALYELGIPAVPIGEKLLKEAIKISNEFALSIYDSIYVSTAKEAHAKWLSSDMQAIKKLMPDLACLATNLNAISRLNRD